MFWRDDRAPTVGKIVAFFKYQSTKQFNDIQGDEVIQKLWQRNYYERIIRDEFELYFTHEHMSENPLRWENHQA